ncbi:MAG TPA: alpha/beta fold hydrolase [Terriglobales bacterium]|nr:alpha/beta fold hydrolase [Terriglobales bacterium]
MKPQTMPPAFAPSHPFHPRLGLAGPHRQTIAATFLPRRYRLPPPEERRFKVEEGSEVLCHCHWQADRHAALTVVLVHGLEGSSDSQYVLGTAAKAWAAGMNVVRMNQRNCGGSERLTPTLYHSGLSGDMGAVARALIAEGLLRLALVGFSMGGNLVTKLAGEWGDGAPPEVLAFAAVSPSMDLAAAADAIHLPENRLYEWNFLRGLERRIRLKVRLFPGRYARESLRWMRSVREFDDQVTARYSGFRDADDYYERSSASRVVDRIARPTLIVHSDDDPFIPLLPLTRVHIRANPNITFLETRRGGHCAFLAPAGDYDGRWAEQTVVEFLSAQFSSASSPVNFPEKVQP